MATLHFPGKTNWFSIDTSCTGCVLRVVSGQAYPASLAVGKADFYDGQGTLITSVVDPAPDDDSDFLQHDEPIAPGTEILVGITDANGNGDHDTWVPWYATVIATP